MCKRKKVFPKCTVRSVAENGISGVARIGNLVLLCIPYFEENHGFQL